MRARLRRWSKRAARSKKAARSVIFDDCSAWVVGFLRLPNALEKVKRSSRDRFWLRRWGISKTVTRTSGTSTNKEIWIASILSDFGQLGGAVGLIFEFLIQTDHRGAERKWMPRNAELSAYANYAGRQCILTNFPLPRSLQDSQL